MDYLNCFPVPPDKIRASTVMLGIGTNVTGADPLIIIAVISIKEERKNCKKAGGNKSEIQAGKSVGELRYTTAE